MVYLQDSWKQATTQDWVGEDISVKGLCPESKEMKIRHIKSVKEWRGVKEPM